jgi:hypothetical protein
MIRSQSFGKPTLLDLELQQRFLAFPPLGKMGWLKWAGVRYPPHGKIEGTEFPFTM